MLGAVGLGSHRSCVTQVEALHSEDMARVQERYRALDLPVGQLDDHKWVMQLAPETSETSLGQ